MCISWYDMTLSCSVPTWCHSGGSYELTAPVYNFLLIGGKYLSLICGVLYTVHSINAHAYWLDFSTQTFPAVLELVHHDN